MAQLQKLSKALGLPFIPATETGGEYSVSHSGNLAIVGPDGSLRGHIAPRSSSTGCARPCLS